MCDDYGGVAPPPVALTHPPVNAPATVASGPAAPASVVGAPAAAVAGGPASVVGAPAAVVAVSPGGKLSRFTLAPSGSYPGGPGAGGAAAGPANAAPSAAPTAAPTPSGPDLLTAFAPEAAGRDEAPPSPPAAVAVQAPAPPSPFDVALAEAAAAVGAPVRRPTPPGPSPHVALRAEAVATAPAPTPIPGRPVDAPGTVQPEPAPPAPGAPAPAPAAPPAAPAAPPAAPAAAPAADAPISTAAALAVLDLSDRPRSPRPPSTPPAPVEPPPPARVAGAPVGVVKGAKASGRRRTDAVAYDGVLVLASPGAPLNLLAPQLSAQDAASRRLDANLVEDVVVREDRAGGKAKIRLRSGEAVVLTWPGRKNRGVAVETLLAHAFPGKVDLGPSELGRRAARTAVRIVVAAALLGAVGLGLATLLKGDPPAPPPPAPPVTLAPAEQAARAELTSACPPWQAFAAGVPAGERPDPTRLRPIVDGIRARFDNAANVGADPAYAAARDEVAFLQDYARRTPDQVELESISRVNYALRTVSAACTRAGAGS